MLCKLAAVLCHSRRAKGLVVLIPGVRFLCLSRLSFADIAYAPGDRQAGDGAEVEAASCPVSRRDSGIVVELLAHVRHDCVVGIFHPVTSVEMVRHVVWLDCGGVTSHPARAWVNQSRGLG